MRSIEGIKFTTAEVKILACLTDESYNIHAIARILNKNARTVYSHLHNIKQKIEVWALRAVADFVHKSSDYEWLKETFTSLKQERQLQNSIEQISSSISSLNVNCVLLQDSSVSEKLTEELASLIEQLSIRVDRDEQVTKGEKHDFYLTLKQSDGLQYKIEAFYFPSQKRFSTPVQKKQLITYIDDYTKLNFYKFLLEILADKYHSVKELQDIYRQAHGGTKVGVFYKYKFLWWFAVVCCVGLLYKFVDSDKENPQDSKYNIPLQLEYHVARGDFLQKIWSSISLRGKAGQALRVVGLYGLGGVGKTTLATSLIRDTNKKYLFRGWFSAEEESLLKAGYFQLGEKLKLFKGSLSDYKKVALVKEWLNARGKILLVYDNAPDIEQIRQYLPDQGDVIITSRDGKLPGALEVDVLQVEQAKQLLSNLLRKNNNLYFTDDDLKKLAKVLGYLPLALSQAGTYMAENALSVDEYLKIYAEQKEQLLSGKHLPVTDVHDPVYITWDLVANQIEDAKYGADALKALNFISLFYAENIPKNLLGKCLYKNFDSQDWVSLNLALGLLKKYSMIKYIDGKVSIHRLVHEWRRAKLSSSETLDFIKRSIVAIEEIFYVSKKMGNSSFIKSLLPHIESIYLHAKDNNLVTVQLLSMLGTGYFIAGDYISSKKYLEMELAHYKNHSSMENRASKANAMVNLGLSLHKLGDYSQAKSMLEKALYEKEELYGKQHVELADILVNISRACLNLGYDKEAKEKLQRALAIKENHFGKGHVENAHILHQLGKTYLHLGHDVMAYETLKEALELNEKQYGEQNIKTAFTLRQLGRVARNLGNYSEALQLLEKSLVIQEKYYGEAHVELAFTLHILGRTYTYYGEYDKGENLLNKALKIRKKYYGDEHVKTAHIYDALGVFNYVAGDVNKAINYLEKSLKIMVKHYGKEHVLTLRTLGNLGFSYIKSKQLTKGTEIINNVHDIVNRTMGQENVFTFMSLANLGNTKRLQGNYAEAEKTLLLALEMARNVYKEDNVAIASILANLALVYKSSNNTQKAQEAFSKAAEIFKKYLHKNNIHLKQLIADSLPNRYTSYALPSVGYPMILLV